VDAVRRHVPHCLLVFTSTDLVYDGEGPPYVADPAAPPRPATVYGETKLAFEHEVRGLIQQA
jgi:dTDP-4-dehydrorhamnose reductase